MGVTCGKTNQSSSLVETNALKSQEKQRHPDRIGTLDNSLVQEVPEVQLSKSKSRSLEVVTLPPLKVQVKKARWCSSSSKSKEALATEMAEFIDPSPLLKIASTQPMSPGEAHKFLMNTLRKAFLNLPIKQNKKYSILLKKNQNENFRYFGELNEQSQMHGCGVLFDLNQLTLEVAQWSNDQPRLSHKKLQLSN